MFFSLRHVSWGRRLVNRLRPVKFLVVMGVIAAGIIVATYCFHEWPWAAHAQVPHTGFDLRQMSIDRQLILAGGPPKDGIPALSNPQHVRHPNAELLSPESRVIGVSWGGEQRAYPLAILNYHEIVNDILGQTPLAVTYCPLCDSVAVFHRVTPLGEREFGVSGLLYNSNVLMYDRRGTPESLWSQVRTAGISGPGMQKSLKALPCELTTWKSWLRRFPETTVLSFETGHRRDYLRNPYADYFTNDRLMFKVQPMNERLPNKERVLGVWVGESYRAFPESRLPKDGSHVTETIAGKSITVGLDDQDQTIRVTHADDGVSWVYSFWFAWYAFHPETTVHGD